MAYAQETVTYAGQGGVAVKPENLQSLIENFDPLLTTLEQLIHRSAGCADRVCGVVPQEAASANAKSPEPNHLIWAARARLDRFNTLLNRLSNEVARLEIGLA